MARRDSVRGNLNTKVPIITLALTVSVITGAAQRRFSGEHIRNRHTVIQHWDRAVLDVVHAMFGIDP